MAQETPNHTQTVAGWAAYDSSGKIDPFIFKRRENGVNDVTIEILYCGICHTDLHFATNDWGITMYPCVPGHEITGVVVKVGSNVRKFSVGDRVGIGYLAASCLNITYGGYSKMIVADHRYVVRIPDSLPMDSAAPLLCAGITVFTPFKDNQLLNSPRKKIGIVGLGGLGHVAVKFGKAFGHHVTAKQRLGADEFIISTSADQMKHSLGPVLELLKVNGILTIVGAPDAPLDLPALPLILGKRTVKGSTTGGILETQEMMDLCGKHNITSDIETVTPDQINHAMDRLARNDVRYRFVIDIAGKTSN
ncbi:hypothetical protein CRG98_004497 [Punica granatum]|uniref:Enoyl reductase (ER) domain-containing protein n=1 Tax=Punica granatum TaxID=22663 RepID=A0A2I0L394_PUNGR|nr:hypothetical protein CRG98_004497 [Punica granatum]